MTLQRKTLSEIVTVTRASTATYFDGAGVLQVAAVDQPRLDYDPATLLPRGFLVEESRTNLLLKSEVFSDAAWAKTRSSISANVATAPDGAMTADKLVIDTTPSNNHSTGQNFSAVSGTTYAFSVFAKAAEFPAINMRFSANLAGNVAFDLTTGVFTAAGGISGVMVPIGNGWYRCVVIQSATASGAVTAQIFLSDGASISIPTADGTSGVLIWGAQLEVGSFPTSYIPTTTAAVTRARDTAVISGAAFSDVFNPTEGTIVAEGAAYNLATNRGLFAISNGTATDEFFGFATTGGNMLHPVRVGDVVQGDNLRTGVVTVGVPFKTARAYKADDLRAAVNGVLATADTSAALPSGMNRMTIGHRGDPPTYGFPVNGHIRKVLYYPVSLTNTQLQTVTT